ncbi:GH13901, partial [Drosophila grimshawi]
RIPEVLRQCIDAFCRTFDVDQESLSMHESLQTEASPTASPSSQNFSFFDPNNSINSSKLTPMQMSLNASNMLDTVDPALLPIKSNEIKPLVKVLHIISESINERFGSRLEACYEREDFFGKLARQMLCAPMTEKWFEKSSGNVEFYEKQLPARVSLRPLASISSLCLMAISLCFGHFWCGFPSVGILILCVVFLMYRILLAVLS